MKRTQRTIALSMGLVLLASFAGADVGPEGPRLPLPKQGGASAGATQRASSAATVPLGEARYAQPAAPPAPAQKEPATLAPPKPAESTVWVPGRFEMVTTTVIEPQEQREVWIAPVIRCGYDYVACRPTREMVREGRWEHVREPLRVARRETLQWSPGYEQSVGASVARGTLDAPAQAASTTSRPIAQPAPRAHAPVVAPREERKPAKPGFDLSTGWAPSARSSERR